MATIEQIKTVSGGESPAPMRWWNTGRSFLTEVRNEMRRVTWPSSREVYATTIVVLLVSAFFGAYLWVVDLGLDQVVSLVFRLFGAV
jgi:preprotein translocase subunit SecE